MSKKKPDITPQIKTCGYFLLLVTLLTLTNPAVAGNINFSANYNHNWGATPPWKTSFSYSSPIISNPISRFGGYWGWGHGPFWGSIGYYPGLYTRSIYNQSPFMRGYMRYPIPNYLDKKKWTTRLAQLSETKKQTYLIEKKQAEMIKQKRETETPSINIPKINIEEPSETTKPQETKIIENGSVVMNFY